MAAFSKTVQDFFWGERWRSRGMVALIVWFIAIIAYYGLAKALGVSGNPGDAHFDQLANSLLHGHLYLDNPQRTEDMTLHEGRWYLPYLPAPTLFMLPWVAITGLEAFKPVLFNTMFAAANVALVFLILDALARRNLSRLSRCDNLWLTLLFALGSVHWSVALGGSVWYISQICTVTFMALAAWLALEMASPLLIGLALALAMGARPHIILAWPLLLGLTLSLKQWAPSLRAIKWREVLLWTVQSAVPIVCVGLLILAYNAARFSSPLDFGYATMNVGHVFTADLATYGWFNLHYVPKNFWAMLLAGPDWVDSIDFWRPNLWGMSLLLTTPALVYLARVQQKSWTVLGATLSVALILIPLLTYSSTGYGQFGYRYSLDFMIPVMVLLALGAGERVSWLMRALILIGVAVNFFGALWIFQRG